MGLNAAFLGNFTIPKGSRIFKDLVLGFERQSEISWIMFGGVGDYESYFQIKNRVVSIGHYARDDLEGLIQKHQVQLFLLLSVWPETYSYTLSEAINLGIPFIATDIGAVGGRARAYQCGLTVPLQSAVQSIAALLNQILDEPGFLNEQREKILKQRNKLRSRATFTSEMAELYASLLSPSEKKNAEARSNGNDSRKHKLHIGSGPNRITDWINADIFPHPGIDIRLNVYDGLPFQDSSMRFIYSEDFIEHLSLEGARIFLSEAFRVLSPGGVMRVVTPNLAVFARQYINREEGMLKWYRENFNCRTFAEAFNLGMRMGGHLFLYDSETLEVELVQAGFMVHNATYKRSAYPELAGIDIRGDGMSLYYEATRLE